MWIAARCTGAQTTPVYVRVDEKPFWRTEKVKELVDQRLTQLDDIETLIQRDVPEGRQGTWNGPDAFRRSIEGLRERVNSARAFYTDLVRRAEAQTTIETRR